MTTARANIKRSLEKMHASTRERATQKAHENGFATLEDYANHLHKRSHARWQIHEERLRKERLQYQNTGSPVLDRGLLDDEPREDDLHPRFDSKKCKCREHLGLFCPGNLRTVPNSLDGFAGELDQERRPKINELVVDPRRPSKRLPETDLDLLWSANSQEKRYKLALPPWAGQEKVTQFAISGPTPGHVEHHEERGQIPDHMDVDHAVAPDVEAPQNHTQIATESNPANKNSQKRGRKAKTTSKRKMNTTSKEQLGRAERAPSMKKTKAKEDKGAVPQWLRSMLEKPRQTRSQESRVFFELDRQSRIVESQLPRRSQRKAGGC
ncbi:MAG: hypothetical protein Q9220_003806 [cf. Caloplaca sp. 1 TL-2023]